MYTRIFYFLISIGLFTSSQVNAQETLHAELLATWKKHTDMTTLLLKGIKKEYLGDMSTSGGRSVGQQFAHMHEVRMMWVGEMLKSIDTQGLDTEIDANESGMKDYLTTQLALSDQVMSKLLEEALKEGTKFGEMSAVRFMSYLIAHEAHTRGQIILVLKQSMHILPPEVTYGIWQW